MAAASSSGGGGGSSEWAGLDIGDVAVAGSSSGSDANVSISGSGADIWDNTDEFHYRYRNWTGDGVFEAYVATMTHTHDWAKAGIMIRENLTPGSRHILLALTPRSSTGVFWRTATGEATQFAALQSSAHSLRLVRTGNTFTAYHSPNRVDWIAVGPPVTLDLPATVYAGLAVTSHNDGALCSASFESVRFDSEASADPIIAPSNLTVTSTSSTQIALGWTDNSSNETEFHLERSNDNVNWGRLAELAANTTTHADNVVTAGATYHYRVRAAQGTSLSQVSNTVMATAGDASPPPPPTWSFGDIGAVGIAGSNESSGNKITIRGSGSDVWETVDAFRFVYRTLAGDGVVEARIDSVQDTDGWAKAGVMIRASADASAANVFALVTPSYHGIVAQARAAAGGETINQAGPTANAPYWVRLRRAGNTFNAFASPDGSTWTQYATFTVPMGSTALFGFAVTSHDNAELNTAVFSDPFVE